MVISIQIYVDFENRPTEANRQALKLIRHLLKNWPTDFFLQHYKPSLWLYERVLMAIGIQIYAVFENRPTEANRQALKVIRHLLKNWPTEFFLQLYKPSLWPYERVLMAIDIQIYVVFENRPTEANRRALKLIRHLLKNWLTDFFSPAV